MTWAFPQRRYYDHKAWGHRAFSTATITSGSGTSCTTCSRWGDSQAISNDPLLNRSLEKHSVSLTVTGSFQKVLAFLRSLEGLQTFVLVSDMNIERQRQRSQENFDRFEVAMDFKLTAYGRQQTRRAQTNESGN